MDSCLAVFASATTVNRVKSFLKKKYNIESVIVQTPKEIPAKGCGYSLRIKRENVDLVWTVIENNGLSSKGIYTEYDYAKIK